MSSYHFTSADRGPDGLITIEPPDPPAVSRPGRPALAGNQLRIAVAGVLLALVLIGLAQYAAPSSGPTVSMTVSTTAPTAAPPTLTPFGAPLDAALVAYFDYQRLDTATALDHGTRVQPVARIGQEWLQLQLVSGAAVWVRWRDFPAPGTALDALPDLAPPTPAPTDPPTATPAPVYVPPQPTTDTRPISCVTTEAGQRCRRGLDEHDSAVATEIAATTEAYSAPFQAVYSATATAAAGH